MEIRRIRCGMYAANAYLVYEKDGDEALLIDAGDALPELLRSVDDCGKRLAHILLTHGHFDHILAAGRLRKATGAELLIGAGDADYLIDPTLNCYDARSSRLTFEPCRADRLLGKGPISLAGMAFEVIVTPGHTPGGLCLWHEPTLALFTGDTLFERGYGRLDLPGGDEAAMIDSLSRLLRMSDAATVYAGHGSSATLGEIKEAWA